MYSGVDKYGGDIVCNYNQPDVDIADVLATSSATETIVATDENNKEILLEAHLNVENGQLKWCRSTNNSSTYKMVVTMSQMASMLNDNRRNELYNKAIKRAIQDFIVKNGFAPVVLDIGCGTGLLSLEAARAGAKKVYGCEQFKEMAKIAQQVIHENNYDSIISIFPVRSTSLHCNENSEMSSSEEYYSIEKCDILVSELLDTELLGEGVIDTVRQAKSTLLKSNAIIIPDYAEVWVEAINSSELYNNINTTNLNIEGIPITINNTKNCRGNEKILPIQYQEYQSRLLPLSDPSLVCYVNLADPGEPCIRSSVIPLSIYSKDHIISNIRSQSLNYTPMFDKHTINMNGLLFFWKLYIYEDIVYSTGIEIDHQLDSYKQIFEEEHNMHIDESNYKDCLKTMIQETWQDHWLVGYYCLENKRVSFGTNVNVLYIQEETQWKFRVYKENEKQENLQELIQPSSCTCGLHFLFPSTILLALNNNYIYSTFYRAIQKVVKNQQESTNMILDVGDGCIPSLIYSYIYNHKYRTHTNTQTILSLDNKELSQYIFTQICDANSLSDIQIVNGTIDNTAITSLQEGSITVLLSDIYRYQMLNSPVMAPLAFWAQRTALNKYLSKDFISIPSQATIHCLPVFINDLYHSFGPVKAPSGFSHQSFNSQCQDWYQYLYPYPLHMYKFSALSSPIPLVSIYYGKTFQPIHQSIHITIEQSGTLQALVLYVDYSLLKDHSCDIITYKDNQFIPTEKQLIRFFKEPHTVMKGDTFEIEVVISENMDFSIKVNNE